MPEAFKPTDRDAYLARLAVARAQFQHAITALDEITHLCVAPEDDKKGKKRKEWLDEALEAVGVATRALETAEAQFDHVDKEEGEPWDGDEDEEDEDEEEDEEDDDEEDE